jgi:hypothetical protein
MAKLSLAKLERHLYAAADILRREGRCDLQGFHIWDAFLKTQLG